MLARIIALLLTTTYLLLATPAFAASSTPSAIPSVSPLQPVTYNLPTSISPTSPLYTDLLVNNLFHSFSCLAIGQSMIGQPCLSYQVTKNAQGMLQGIPVLSQTNLSGGALGGVTSVIGALYQNPPVRTADYLASVGQGLGIVKEANAQVVGSGAAVLNPILTLWQVSRNVSYVIMIIIFLVIGLMVMFRNKLNPQTVITAQAALPGLIIGLVLITFSYFLAGLVSDTAFVGTNLVGYYFAAAQGKTDDPERTNLVDTISSKNVFSFFGPLTGIVSNDKASAALDSLMNELGPGVQAQLRFFASWLGIQFISPVAGGIPPPWGLVAGPVISVITGLSFASAPTFFLGFFISIVATFALIYTMLKLLLRLISSFLTIIFLTISAPFQFLAASLPGRQGIATAWILNMLANILVFPAVLAVFYFVAFILGSSVVGVNYPLKVSYSNRIEIHTFIPTALAQTQGVQITGKNTFPLLGGLDLSFINILLAFGALMALPKIPDIVVSAIGRMGQAGQLLGQEISGGVRSGQGYAGQLQGNVSGGVSNIKRGDFGQHDYRWVPGVGMEYGPIKPGLAQAVDRGKSWNPLKWKFKEP